MGLTTELTEVVVRLTADQAKKEIAELRSQSKLLEKQLDAVGKGDPAQRKQIQLQIDEANAKIKALRASLKENITVIINGEVAGKSLNDLKLAAKALRTEVNMLADGTVEFANKSKQLQKVTDQIDLMNNKVKGTDGFFSKIKDELKAFGVIAAGYLGFQAITSQISNIISSNAKLSDSLADIQMTTGLTAGEVQKLNTELGKIDTRTATAALRDIAKVAGQFGVAKSELLGFAEAVNKTSVVLSSEFGGGAEEIATVLAKLRNVLSDIKTNSIDDDLTKLGNGLTRLAQEGVATAPVVADFANRIGGIGISLGLTSGQVLGLSATMQELAISTERGGTAVGKILQKMTSNTADFAKVAGVSLESFTKLVNTNIYEAFNKFLAGTKKGGDSATALSAILKDAELSGAGASEVIAKLANNATLLAERTNLASDAITKTDTITTQYALKNQTLGAELDKLGKKFYSTFSNQSANDFFAGAIRSTGTLLDSLKAVFKFIGEYKEAILLVATAYLTFSKGSKLAEDANNRFARILTTDLSDALGKAENGFKSLWATMRANPLGAIITGIQLATALFFVIRNSQKAHREEVEKASLAYEEFKNNVIQSRAAVDAEFEALKKSNISIEDKKRIIDELNSKYGQYLPNLLTEKSSLDEIETAQLAVNKALLQKIILDSNSESIKQKLEEKIRLQDELNKITRGITIIEEYKGASQKLIESQIADIDKYIASLDNLKEKRLEAFGISSTALPEDVIAYGPDPVKKKTVDSTQPATPFTEEQIKAAEKSLEKYKEIYRQLRDARIAAMEDGYSKEIEQADVLYYNEVARIQKEVTDKKQQTELLTTVEENYVQQISSIKQKYAIADAAKQAEAIAQGMSAENAAAKQAAADAHAIREKEINDAILQQQKKINALKKGSVEYYAESFNMLILQMQKELEASDLTEQQRFEIWKKFEQAKNALLDNELANEHLHYKEKIALLDAELAKELENTALNEEQKFQLIQEYEAKKAQLWEESGRVLSEQQYKNYQQSLQYANQAFSIASAYIQLQNQKAQNADDKTLAHEKANSDKKKAALKKELDAKRISQEEYSAALEKIDSDFDRKKHELAVKAFKREQKMRIVEAIMQGASAIMQIFATMGPPASYILAALQAVLTGIQIATISNQQPPAYGKGGKFQGVIDGPSHAEGGMDVVDTRTGLPVANIEGNEVILSAATYRQNKPMVDALLFQSQNRNGAALDNYPVNIDNSPAAIPLLQNGGWLQFIDRAQIPAAQKVELWKIGKQLAQLLPQSDYDAPAPDSLPNVIARNEAISQGGNPSAPVDSKALINAIPPPPEGTDGKVLINAIPPPPEGTDGKALINAIPPPPEGTDGKALINAIPPPPEGTDGKALINAIPPPPEGTDGKALINAIPPPPEGTDGKALINAIPPPPEGTDGKALINAIPPPPEGTDGKVLINAIPPPPESTDSKVLINKGEFADDTTSVQRMSKPLINFDGGLLTQNRLQQQKYFDTTTAIESLTREQTISRVINEQRQSNVINQGNTTGFNNDLLVKDLIKHIEQMKTEIAEQHQSIRDLKFKSYVVLQDLQDAQDLDKRIKKKSQLG